jgi:hypothetical protein
MVLFVVAKLAMIDHETLQRRCSVEQRERDQASTIKTLACESLSVLVGCNAKKVGCQESLFPPYHEKA